MREGLRGHQLCECNEGFLSIIDADFSKQGEAKGDCTSDSDIEVLKGPVRGLIDTLDDERSEREGNVEDNAEEEEDSW